MPLPFCGPALTDWLSLFIHHGLAIVLSIGGALPVAPEMHRFLIDQQHWMSDAQFSSSIAITQAAPGPNVLFVALLGWNVGLNAGGRAVAMFGVLVTMTGILLPSSTLCCPRWLHRNRELRAIPAFRRASGDRNSPSRRRRLDSRQRAQKSIHRLAALAADRSDHTDLWRSKVHFLWLLAAGAILGWFALV